MYSLKFSSRKRSVRKYTLKSGPFVKLSSEHSLEESVSVDRLNTDLRTGCLCHSVMHKQQKSRIQNIIRQCVLIILYWLYEKRLGIRNEQIKYCITR